MTERVWRIGGMMPTRKSRIPQRKIFSKATLPISNPTNWPGTELRKDVLYNYCVFKVNNVDLLSSILKISNGEWKIYKFQKRHKFLLI
jgi:hypothetical protein